MNWGDYCEVVSVDPRPNYSTYHDTMELEADPWRVMWLLFVIVIAVDEWLATASYASGWPGTVLEVPELVHGDRLRAHSVLVISVHVRQGYG